MNILGFNALQNKIKQEAIVVDPIGAILISVYIIISWILQANSKSRSLNYIWVLLLFFLSLSQDKFVI